MCVVRFCQRQALQGDETVSTCEKCWSEAGLKTWMSGDDRVDCYRTLIVKHTCTPEESAGPDATSCEKCGGRRVRHQYTKECMVVKEHNDG